MTFPGLEFLDILTLSIAMGTLFEAPTLSAIAQCFLTAFASGPKFYIDPTLYGTKIICFKQSY